MGDIRSVVIQVVALLLAITIHEAAHGWVAWRNGDPTAKLAGRITLNPIPHLDLFGSLIFPGLLILMHAPVLIGWAKPVPVNPLRFRKPRKGFAQVSIAGPGSNFALAAIAAVILKVWTAADPELLAVLTGEGGRGVNVALPLFLFLWVTIQLNVVLGVFNLLPIPPLDGGHFLIGLLPPRQSASLARIEPFGMMIILALVWLGALDLFVRPVSQIFLRLFLW